MTTPEMRCALCGFITGHLPECAYFRAKRAEPLGGDCGYCGEPVDEPNPDCVGTYHPCPTCMRDVGDPAPECTDLVHRGFREIPVAKVCPTCERPFGAAALPPTIEELAAAIWNADLSLGNTSSGVEGEDLWWHEAEAEDKWPGSRADTRKQAEVILAWLREPAPDFFARGGCPHTPKCDPNPCPEYTPPSPKWPAPEGGHE